MLRRGFFCVGHGRRAAFFAKKQPVAPCICAASHIYLLFVKSICNDRCRCKVTNSADTVAISVVTLTVN